MENADTRCHCACHRTGPRAPSCADCAHMHHQADPPALGLEVLGSVATQPMKTPQPERLAGDTRLVDELARVGDNQRDRAAAIDRIACRLLEHATGVEQVSTHRTRGPLPPQRLEAIEKLAIGHRDEENAGLHSVTLSPQLAGAIAMQLADFAEAIDANQRRTRNVH